MELKNSGLNGIQTFASLGATNNGVTKLHVGNKANLRGFSLVKKSFFQSLELASGCLLYHQIITKIAVYFSFSFALTH